MEEDTKCQGIIVLASHNPPPVRGAAFFKSKYLCRLDNYCYLERGYGSIDVTIFVFSEIYPQEITSSHYLTT